MKKNIYPSFPRRMVAGGDPSTSNFGSNWPRWSEIADFQSIFARSASAVTSSKKVQLTQVH